MLCYAHFIGTSTNNFSTKECLLLVSGIVADKHTLHMIGATACIKFIGDLCDENGLSDMFYFNSIFYVLFTSDPARGLIKMQDPFN